MADYKCPKCGSPDELMIEARVAVCPNRGDEGHSEPYWDENTPCTCNAEIQDTRLDAVRWTTCDHTGKLKEFKA